MKSEDLTEEMLSRLSKRARMVVDHIRQHGSISTEDLEKMGYSHAPRAIRDVREAGIPLKMTMGANSKGGRMANYVFDDVATIEHHKIGGRRIFSKTFSRALFASFGNRCAFCNEYYEDRYLQVDHRVPYEVAGESGRIGDEGDSALFVPVCGTCNRKKSWSCEHCENWLVTKKSAICETCYWASPEKYTHIAGRNVRRLEIVWTGDEVARFDEVAKVAKRLQLPIQTCIKAALDAKIVAAVLAPKKRK